MIEGDKVICKKTWNRSSSYFFSGDTYHIHHITYNAFYISKYTLEDIRTNGLKGRSFGRWFYFKADAKFEAQVFKNYFYTETELRKLKLKKIARR